jgi:hypothetical protein
VESISGLKVNDQVVVCLDRSDKEGTLTVANGHITEISENLYCTVDFLDGTTSNDVYLSDIKQCECNKQRCNGQHISGALVYVQWSDGMIYEGYYRTQAPVMSYSVRLDGILYSTNNENPPSLLTDVGRDSLFLPNEELPKRARRVLRKRRLGSNDAQTT